MLRTPRPLATRIAAAALVAVGLATLGPLAAPAAAMGTDDPYQDMQVGVTYTVYEPSYTAGLDVSRANGIECPSGMDEAFSVTYGSRRTTSLVVVEGKPICADPVGVGKQVWTGTVQGRKAAIVAYCDETDEAAWASCSKADVAKVGGALIVVLPKTSGLRATEVNIITSGSTPLSAQQLVKVARSMEPVNG